MPVQKGEEKMKNYRYIAELEKDDLVKILMSFINGDFRKLFFESDMFRSFDLEECIDWWLLADKDDPNFGIDAILKSYDQRYEKSW